MISRLVRLLTIALLLVLFNGGAAQAETAYYIYDDATGGACSLIGIWNPETKECLLTSDIKGPVIIMNDGITLNGGGHVITDSIFECGIILDYRNGVTVKNITVRQVYHYGICVSYSSDITITDSAFLNNGYTGIYTKYSGGNTFSSNVTSNNTWGIHLYRSDNNTLINNTASGNGYEGLRLSYSSDNTIANNLLTNNNIGVVFFYYCYDNTFSQNTISNNSAGVHVNFSSGNTLSENIFVDNSRGAYLYFSDYTNVYRNTFSNHSGGYALGVDRSNYVQVYNNDFVNNPIPLSVWDGTGNLFNLVAPIGGNYWSNFDTPEEGCNNLNGDDFCDTQYRGDNLPWTRQSGWANLPPVADAGGPYSVNWGAELVLDGSGSSDPDDNIASYEWDLDNDGEYDDASGVTWTVSFTSLGEQQVGLRVTDEGGLSDTDTATVTVVDPTPPVITWVGDIEDGDEYYFGDVPPAPTCTATDDLSGVDGGCTVSGYEINVGVHTLTAIAKDYAGNQATETRSYTVMAWTLSGFYPPIDMNGVFNVAKNGGTIPLKFEIFVGGTELTDIANIKSITSALITCDTKLPSGEEVLLPTGGTVLRYDLDEGQFIFNWNTPTTPATCYRVTLTALDGSSLVAYFKLK